MFAVLSHTFWEEPSKGVEVHVYHALADPDVVADGLIERKEPGRHGVSHFIKKSSALMEAVLQGIELGETARVVGASPLKGRVNIQIVVEVEAQSLNDESDCEQELSLDMGTGVSYKGWSWKEKKVTSVTGVVIREAVNSSPPAMLVFGQGRTQVVQVAKLEAAQRPREHILAEIRGVEMNEDGYGAEEAEEALKALYAECGESPTEDEIWGR